MNDPQSPRDWLSEDNDEIARDWLGEEDNDEVPSDSASYTEETDNIFEELRGSRYIREVIINSDGKIVEEGYLVPVSSISEGGQGYIFGSLDRTLGDDIIPPNCVLKTLKFFDEENPHQLLHEARVIDFLDILFPDGVVEHNAEIRPIRLAYRNSDPTEKKRAKRLAQNLKFVKVDDSEDITQGLLLEEIEPGFVTIDKVAFRSITEMLEFIGALNKYYQLQAELSKSNLENGVTTDLIINTDFSLHNFLGKVIIDDEGKYRLDRTHGLAEFYHVDQGLTQVFHTTYSKDGVPHYERVTNNPIGATMAHADPLLLSHKKQAAVDYPSLLKASLRPMWTMAFEKIFGVSHLVHTTKYLVHAVDYDKVPDQTILNVIGETTLPSNMDSTFLHNLEHPTIGPATANVMDWTQFATVLDLIYSGQVQSPLVEQNEHPYIGAMLFQALKTAIDIKLPNLENRPPRFSEFLDVIKQNGIFQKDTFDAFFVRNRADGQDPKIAFWRELHTILTTNVNFNKPTKPSQARKVINNLLLGVSGASSVSIYNAAEYSLRQDIQQVLEDNTVPIQVPQNTADPLQNKPFIEAFPEDVLYRPYVSTSLSRYSTVVFDPYENIAHIKGAIQQAVPMTDSSTLTRLAQVYMDMRSKRIIQQDLFNNMRQRVKESEVDDKTLYEIVISLMGLRMDRTVMAK